MLSRAEGISEGPAEDAARKGLFSAGRCKEPPHVCIIPSCGAGTPRPLRQHNRSPRSLEAFRVRTGSAPHTAT